MDKKDIKNKIINEFRKKFTVKVEYTKWPDEEAQRLPHAQIRWNNPYGDDETFIRLIEHFLIEKIGEI